jgi:hypothetical protein
MTKTKVFVAAVLSLAVMFGGCASAPKETGFLSTYANLQPVSSTFMRYIAPDNAMGKYSKFIVDPVTIHLYDQSKLGKFDPQDLEHLKQYMYQAVRQSLAERYQIVSDPGPGVARLRIAITDLKKSSPVLNAIPQTKMTGVGLGQAAVEGEMVDSQTGKQIVAAIDSETGSRFSFAGLSKWGDVEAIMNDWAKRLRTRIDEAHGQ